jgi:hypothetical protein
MMLQNVIHAVHPGACAPLRPVPYRTSPAAIHPAEDRLEMYAMERPPEPEAAPLEEHLLVCKQCRVRLAEWDAYIAAVRAAIRGSHSSQRVGN